MHGEAVGMSEERHCAYPWLSPEKGAAEGAAATMAEVGRGRQTSSRVSQPHLLDECTREAGLTAAASRGEVAPEWVSAADTVTGQWPFPALCKYCRGNNQQPDCEQFPGKDPQHLGPFADLPYFTSVP